ncbi:hypothetical protein ACJIZ3_009126 [Penstemon smallii]|uniref:Uncharacterized protein n=1 Tax=Penstemon smallii TaxID=265156 RepID=A0ABD3TCG4_9LAMI
MITTLNFWEHRTHQQILLNTISFQLVVVSTPQFPDDDEDKFINMLIVPTEAIESNVNNLKIWPALIDPRTSDVTMKFLAKDVGIFPSRLFSLRSNVFRPQLAEIVSGIFPLMLFLPRFNTTRVSTFCSRQGGMPPLKNDVANTKGNGFLKVIARVIYVHSICGGPRQLATFELGNSCKLQEARLSALRFGN